MSQPCSQLVLRSNTGLRGIHFARMLLCTGVGLALLYEEQIFRGLFAAHKLAVSLCCTQELGCEASILPEAMLLCTGAGPLHSCMRSRSSRGFCRTQAWNQPVLPSNTGL